MENNKRNLVGFIEELRKSKKLSRDEFCSGIMSKRQYQRYVKGETDISNENLAKFADKLNSSVLLLHRSFDEYENNEIQYIRSLYEKLDLLEFDELYKEFKAAPKKVFSNNYYNSLYYFIELRTLLALKKISAEAAIERLMISSNINALKEGKSFNYVEIASAALLTRLEFKKGNKELLNDLYSIVTNARNLSVFTKTESEWMASTYASIATVFGLHDQPEKVIEVSKIGLDICTEFQLLVTLSNHYYNLALAYKDMGDLEKALNSAKLSLMAARLDRGNQKFLSFKNAIERNFKIKISDLKCFE